tara:strand:- start:577 stop:1077 length:501 start_codon:yes stop_codon:yes gene_type:complete
MPGPYDKIIKTLHTATDKVLRTFGNSVNLKIQKNIESGKDLDDKPFKELSPDSTIPERARKGFDNRPLIRSGKLRKTQVKNSKLKVTIKMTGKKKSIHYGALHNEGYVTSSKSAFPNKRVPARKWFGIPKDFTGNGKEAKKMKQQVRNIIGSAFRGITRQRIRGGR